MVFISLSSVLIEQLLENRSQKILNKKPIINFIRVSSKFRKTISCEEKICDENVKNFHRRY